MHAVGIHVLTKLSTITDRSYTMYTVHVQVGQLNIVMINLFPHIRQTKTNTKYFRPQE